MTWWHEGLLLDGERLDARVEENLISGEHVRSMDGTSTLTLVIHDPERELLESGVLTRPRKGPRPRTFLSSWQRLGKVKTTLGGDPYRLAGVRKDGDRLTLTLEHEITALLRQQHKPLVRSRQSYTRAQFVRELVGRVRERRIAHFIFAAEVPQPIARVQKARPTDGLLEVRIGGRLLTPEQKRYITIAKTNIEKTNAPERAALALLEACIVESTFGNPTYGDGTSVGILQLTDDKLGGSTATRGGRRDVEKVTYEFLTGTGSYAGHIGAIPAARAHPTWDPGQIAQLCQGSAFPERYEQHREEADSILQAVGGAGGTITVPEDYIFRAGNLDGEREDYWDAIQRLAAEVGWHAFVADNAFWYAKDRDLLKRAPVMMIAEQPGRRLRNVGVQYVGNIDFDWDYRKPVAELTFGAPAGELFAYPGASAEVVDLGPADGRYLLEEIRDPLGDVDQEFTLRRAAPQKPEPAPNVTTISLSGTASDGPARQRVVEIALATRSAQTNYYYYSQPGKLTENPTPPTAPAGSYRSDCSQWTRAIYLKAGLPDPGTNTTQQLANSRRVSVPRPGDLVFDAPSGANHVELFTGQFGIEGSDTIGHGSPPIDGWTVADMRAHFGGVIFGTFDFLDEGIDTSATPQPSAAVGGQTAAGGKKRGF